MKPELNTQLLHKKGNFIDRKNSRVSDKWYSALMLIDCESELEAIEVIIWQGRGGDSYYCTTKIDFGEFYLQSNARAESIKETVRTAFKQMGVTWDVEPEDPAFVSLRSADVEKVFMAIAREIGVKRPKTIRAGYQPIYRI